MLVPADIHAHTHTYIQTHVFAIFTISIQSPMLASLRALDVFVYCVCMHVCACVQVLELPALSVDTIRFQLSAVEWFGGLLAN